MKLRGGSPTQAAGARHEDAALAHLQHAGLALVERNFHCRHGEIDLVMRDGDTVVFAEVRYRRGAQLRGGHGGGLESVGVAKRTRLIRSAQEWLARNPRLSHCACRFDVVALTGDGDTPSIDWCRNAFDAG